MIYKVYRDRDKIRRYMYDTFYFPESLRPEPFVFLVSRKCISPEFLSPFLYDALVLLLCFFAIPNTSRIGKVEAPFRRNIPDCKKASWAYDPMPLGPFG